MQLDYEHKWSKQEQLIKKIEKENAESKVKIAALEEKGTIWCLFVFTVLIYLQEMTDWRMLGILITRYNLNYMQSY